MKKKLKRDKSKTMTEQVYEKLEELIVLCKIEPGTILTESEISEFIGAGRTPVREALRLLANESLVSVSRIGVLIPEMSGATQLQLLEIRRVILKLCVEKAIDRLTELDKKSINELLELVDKEDNVEYFLNWLKQRHKVLAKCTKNQFLYEELRNVQGLTHRFWYYYAKEDDHKKGKTLHVNILKAILQRDTQKATIAVNALLDYLEEFSRLYSVQ